MPLEQHWIGDPAELLRVNPQFVLAEQPTDASPGFDGGKKAGATALTEGAGILSGLQERFFAGSLFGDRRSVLLVLQAMDTAGKGGIVRHVVGAVDPQGVHHHAFKKPSEEELAHDFLWRVRRELPEAGQLGVFDRSHYEDVLIARVRALADETELHRRYRAINNFESELVETGTTVIKVMLHLGNAEQKARLAKRLDRPDKYWKYTPGDVDERLNWDAYQDAYATVFELTNTEAAPWYVIPADKKWYARLAVQWLLIDALRRLDPRWPSASYDVEAEKARLAAS
ncbi:MAG: PPK2 family polyphosphate kinase [Microbacteriaceae bacterium]